jgi:proteic killer suppression protein
MRIHSFRHRGLRRLYETGDGRGINPEFVAKVEDILHVVEQAQNIKQVALFPGWRLHQLKGTRRGEWSIRVSGNFRLTFRLVGQDVINIDLEDYHGK